MKESAVWLRCCPFVIALATTLLVVKANAQNKAESNKPTIRFSPTELIAGGGYTGITFSPDDASRQDAFKWGYAIGLAKAYHLSNRFQIGGKIMYENKGGKQLYDVEFGNPATNSNMIYENALIFEEQYECISIPITLQYNFGRNYRFFVAAGGYFSYKLGMIINTKNLIWNVQSKFDQSDITLNDYGYTASLGMFVPVGGTNKLSVQIVGNLGVANILDYQSFSRRTSSVFILVGFPISGILKFKK